MKLARIGLDQGPRYAALDEENDQFIVLSDDPMFGKIEPSGQRIARDDVRVIAPMLPRSKVVGFKGTCETNDVSKLGVFLKPNTAVIGPEQVISMPAWASGLTYTAELAIVIGRIAKDTPVEKAHEAIFGFTLANDVTATGVAPVLDKVFDASCPLGPVIDTDFACSDQSIGLRLNGKESGETSVSALKISPAELVSFAASIFTLLPGDLILTGVGVTGAGSGENDVVEASLDGLGVLSNRVLKNF